MPRISFSDKEVAAAIRRVNAERKAFCRQSDSKLKFRALSHEFARAFVHLLRNKYRKEKMEEDPRQFEDLMERLLYRLFCVEPDLRHGYKQVAGILFGPLGNYAKARKGNVRVSGQKHSPGSKKPEGGGPIRVILEGKQRAWSM